MASPALQTFIDASAGAAGSLFTCYLLYPLDLAKTQIQSGATKDVRSTLQRILRDHGVLGLFEGLGPRAVQTVLQNFIFFYAYAWLKQRHQKLGYRRSQPVSVAGSPSNPACPSMTQRRGRAVSAEPCTAIIPSTPAVGPAVCSTTYTYCSPQADGRRQHGAWHAGGRWESWPWRQCGSVPVVVRGNAAGSQPSVAVRPWP